MRFKDAVKTTLAVIGSYILMACGQKKDATPTEPNERPLTEAAHGDSRQTLFDLIPENGTMDFADAQAILHTTDGKSVSNSLSRQLQQDSIPVSKKGENDTDSILYSAERVEKDGKVTWRNPKYTLNQKTGNTDQVGDIEVKRKDDSTYQLDPNTIGIKEVTTEIISEEITKARELTMKKSGLNLQEGDTVMVENVPAVYKDNKLQIEKKVIENTEVNTFKFDYHRK